MTESETADARSSPPRDFDGLYKSLLEAHPRDALHLLGGARVDDRDVILDGPTEQPRQRSRQQDKTFLVRRADGGPTDVYHFEIQVQRTEDFQERLVAYWASMAIKYRRADHQLHQIVLWPLGGGYASPFRRDQVQLEYRSVSVPHDLDPGLLLAGPLAPLALWSKKPPTDVAARVADRISATSEREEQMVQVELSMLMKGPLGMQILEELRRKGMNDLLRESETGREIVRERAVSSMRTLLRAKYGDLDDLDDLAERLTDRDHDGNIVRIVSGATVEELRS